MYNADGKAVIRLGDKTSHGGVVITAAEDRWALGIPVATEGCLTYCPTCQGSFAILPGHRGSQHKHKWVAYDGDKTECGAILIASL